MSETSGRNWVPVSINNSNAGRLWEHLNDLERIEIRLEYQETRPLKDIRSQRWCRVNPEKKK